MRPVPPEPAQPVRFSLTPAAATAIGLGQSAADRVVAISPNGRYFAWVTVDGALTVRSVDELDAEPIPGISGARIPFFSADSEWIGFFQGNNEIRKVSVTGGPSVPVCAVSGAPRGANWGPDNIIVFATGVPATGLMAVPAAGGEPTVLSKPDNSNGPADHWHPFVLPGGQILFTIVGNSVENSQIAVLDPKSGTIKILVRGGSHAEYVQPPGGPGYLVYGASGSLAGGAFRISTRLEVTSEARPVVDQVAMTTTAVAEFGSLIQGRSRLCRAACSKP